MKKIEPKTAEQINRDLTGQLEIIPIDIKDIPRELNKICPSCQQQIEQETAQKIFDKLFSRAIPPEEYFGCYWKIDKEEVYWCKQKYGVK